MMTSELFISLCSTLIAFIATSMNWITWKSHARLFHRFQRLHAEFWQQSIQQGNDNCKNWETHRDTAEQHLRLIKDLRVVLNNDKLFQLSQTKQPSKPN